jgi:capsular exopolysaccharide synthesis family protein
MSKRNKKLLTRFEHPQLLNASKTLLANIRFSSVDEQVKTIAVTSSTANEGKTLVSTNLAYAIATSGKNVLIVETDMHYRSLNRLLDQHPAHGIYAALSGAAPLDKAIVSTRIPNLYFMDAEPNIPSPSDVLSTKRCATLIDKLHEMFDFVIFDTPPVSLFVDAAILSNMTDGTLFVARQNQTNRALAAKCVQQLRVANARILGLVMTFCEDDESLYYYAYYTQDGKRADKDHFRHSTKSPDPTVPTKPIVVESDRSTGSAAVEPAASARAALAELSVPSRTKNAAPDASTEAEAASGAYAPNAYRELSAIPQKTSGQWKRKR